MSHDRRADDAPESTETKLHASAGVAVLGDRVVVRGKDLHAECMNLSFVGYALFCVTGRVFSDSQARVFEEFWIATGYPDARIWCNRIAGYLGSARVDPGLAMSAAIAASDSVAYGFGAMRSAYVVQADIPDELGTREEWFARQLESRRVLHGYGRPIHGHDERILAALKTLRDHQIRAGSALKRAFWLDASLREAKGIAMNISGLWAATAIDFGIDAAAYDQFMLLMFAPGYMAVYADQRERPPLSFLAGHQSR